MTGETKVKEWRPEDCGTRVGDVVKTETGLTLLKIKCRRCSKDNGVDMFHYAPIDPADTGFTGPPTDTK